MLLHARAIKGSCAQKIGLQEVGDRSIQNPTEGGSKRFFSKNQYLSVELVQNDVLHFYSARDARRTGFYRISIFLVFVEIQVQSLSTTAGSFETPPPHSTTKTKFENPRQSCCFLSKGLPILKKL